MYRLIADGVKNTNEYNELIRMFIRPGDPMIIEVPEALINPVEEKQKIKKYIYELLKERTGHQPLWGTLTGVKPMKLYEKHSEKTLIEEYLLSQTKLSLLREIFQVQRSVLKKVEKNEVGIYVGIPFCPTRCSYCSFTSNQKDYGEISRYLKALAEEISFVGYNMRRLGLKAETIYLGGGTPTTINTVDLKKLLDLLGREIPQARDFEITVEAGRPDTLNDSNLELLASVDRISINPQTLNKKTLDIIGRSHDIDSIYKSFKMAKDKGINTINMDLIVGLPGEDLQDLKYTLDGILAMEPENITIHTLAVKKGSKLFDDNPQYSYDMNGRVSESLEYAKERVAASFYRPYYIYRQKNMADNLENVGFARPSTECIYNMRVMQEKQTLIALGAGGISKVYFPQEDRLKRIANVSNYDIYIDRIYEMLARKKEGIFNAIKEDM